MRRKQTTSALTPRLAAALLAGAVALASGAPALAGGRIKERVYDDSFGNLIILNPSGYKRIVVGMGHLAAELHAQEKPEIVYRDDDDHHHHFRSNCYRPSVLWHGRSYMYGLSDGEVPMPPVICD